MSISGKRVLFLLSLLLIAGGLSFIFTRIQTSHVNTFLGNTDRTKEWVHQCLNALSAQERGDLTSLFRSLFLNSGFDYTLFDERPMAFSAYFTRVPSMNVHCGFTYPPEDAWWKTWEKYRDFFPMKRFALITTQDYLHNSVRIYLINKKLYFKVLASARPNSQWVVNSGKTLEELSKIFHDFTIEELPNYHELLGILLGFGENNANLFYRRDLLENILSGKHPEYGKSVLMGNLDRFQKELDQINNTLTFMQLPNTYTHLQMVRPLGFLVDNTTMETKKLKVKLQKARDKISAIYSQGNFLEITLEKLISSD